MGATPEDEDLARRSAEQGTQFHDPQGDVWQRHADGPGRDAAADREVREAMQREKHGEYDADGNFRRSTWNPA
jgi:hypothetical protein